MKEPSKRTRDMAKTRRALLQAARAAIARGGGEALNVSEVARDAGVNRSTAYEHFGSREALLEAAIGSVGADLCEELFFSPEREREYLDSYEYQPEMLEKFAMFLMQNPKLARTWLFEVLESERAEQDPLWSRWTELGEKFVKSGHTQDGIDGEVLSVAVIGALFVWTLWVKPENKTPKQRRKLARRFTDAIRRMSILGVYKPSEIKRLKSTLYLG